MYMYIYIYIYIYIYVSYIFSIYLILFLYFPRYCPGGGGYTGCTSLQRKPRLPGPASSSSYRSALT